MAKGAVNIGVNVLGAKEVAAAYALFREAIVNRYVKAGAVKAGRKTVPRVKAGTKPHRRTGLLERARGTKYKLYRRKNSWVVLVGTRAGITATHEFWGHMDPLKYDHLVEGGHKATRPGFRTRVRGGKLVTKATGARVLAIKVKKIDKSKRNAAGYIKKNDLTDLTLYVKQRGRRGKPQPYKVRRWKKVRGGYLIFAQWAGPAKGTKPVESQKDFFRKEARDSIIQEVRAGIVKEARKHGRKVLRDEFR